LLVCVHMSRSFTTEEVARHNKEEDCWIIVNGLVFDVTRFLAEHPGGKKIILKVAGTDASTQFAQFHKPEILAKYSSQLVVGKVEKGAAGTKTSATTSEVFFKTLY
jgi:cytochrome b involved in lipid metabolism